jgi:hypothetical protein
VCIGCASFLREWTYTSVNLLAKTPQEKTPIERQVLATDGQIDRLVYDLYALTPEEIGIVEGTAVSSIPPSVSPPQGNDEIRRNAPIGHC